MKSRMQAAYDRAKADLKENILFPDSDPVLPEDMPVAQSAASIPAEAAETEDPGQESEALAENASPVQDTVPSEPIQVEYVQPKSTEKHYIIAVCDSKERDSEAMLLRLGEFNRRNYSQMGLKTEAVPAGDKYMVVISSFPVLRGAANYLDMVKDDDYVFGTLEFKILFLANEANMELLKEYGDYEGYEAYYKETYGATK